MDLRETLQPAALPRTGRRRTLAIGLVVAVLFAVSYLAMRSPRARQSGATVQLMVEAAQNARTAYLASRSPVKLRPVDVERTVRAAIAAQRRLADRQRTPSALRRLAILQHALGDPGWRETLLRIPSAPRTDPVEATRELDLWRRVMEGPVRPRDVPALRERVLALDLGWHRHLALEALHRNAGMDAEARQAAGMAAASARTLALLALVQAAAALAGLGVLAWFLAHRRRLFALAPRLRQPLSREKADALYSVFLAYLLGMAAQVGLSLLLRLCLPPATRQGMGSAAILVSIPLALVPLVPAWLVFRRGQARTGVTLADVGLRGRGALAGAAWGVGAYAASQPVLLATLQLSQWLFRGLDTPTNPAITEFVRSSSALAHGVLFLQAVLIAPVVEEALFRGVFLQALLPRLGPAGSVLVSAGLFALLHPQLPTGFLGLFALGAIFGVVFLLRGSLVPCILAHAINNGLILAYLVLLLGG